MGRSNGKEGADTYCFPSPMSKGIDALNELLTVFHKRTTFTLKVALG